MTPAIATDIPSATFASANNPVALPADTVTVSPLMTPTSEGDPPSVAVLLWSYTLLFAERPVTVSSFWVMFAVVVTVFNV